MIKLMKSIPSLFCLFWILLLFKTVPVMGQLLPCNQTDFNYQPACVGNAFTFSAFQGALTYQWDFGDGSPIQNGQTVNHIFSTVGNFDVKLIRTGLNCTDTTIKTVSVSSPPPLPDFTHAPNNVPCSGTELTFNVSNPDPDLKYYWVFESGDTLTGNTVRKSPRVFGQGNLNSRVILIAERNGCRSQTQKFISLKAEPQFSFVTNADECLLCNDRILSVIVNTQQPNEVDSIVILWGDNQRTRLTNFNTIINHDYIRLGSFNMQIMVYGKSGCVGRHGCEVKIDTDLNPIEDFIILGGNDAGCHPFEAIIEDKTEDIGPTTVLTLDFGDGTPPQTFTGRSFGQIRHTFRNESNCIVQYPITLSGVSQCYQIVEKKIKYFTIFRPPVIRLDTTSKDVCLTDESRILNLSLPLLGVCSGDTNRPPKTDYIWNWGDGSGNQTATIENKNLPQQVLTHRYNAPGSYTFFLEACDRKYIPDRHGSCRCDTLTFKVNVKDRPTADFNISAETLIITDEQNGGTVILEDHTANVRNREWIITPATGVTYVSGDRNSKRAEVRFTQTGNYTIRLKVSNECGEDETEKTLTVICPPKLRCPQIGDGCPSRTFDPNQIVESDGNSPITGYKWEVYRNDTLLPECSSVSATPPCTSFTVPGLYRLVIEISNSVGTSSCSTSFTVLSLPTISKLPSATLEVQDRNVGNTIKLTNTAGNCTGYTWEIIPATGWEYEPGSDANSFEPVIRFKDCGTYTIKLRGSNACGNVSTDNIGNAPEYGNGTITVICPPQIILPKQPDGCPPLTINLTGLQINDGNNPITSYLWRVFKDGRELDSCRSETINLQCTRFERPGVYIIQLTAANEVGVGFYADTFEVFAIPSPPTVSTVEICQGQQATLNASAEAGSTIEWFDEPNATQPIFLGNPYTTPILNEDKSYYCRGRNQIGCPGEMTVVLVRVVPPPPCIMTPVGDSLTVACGKAVQLGTLMMTDTTNLTFQWTPAEGLSCPTCLRTYAFPVTGTSYTLTVRNSLGCTSTCVQNIRVVPLPEIDCRCGSVCAVCPCERITITVVQQPNMKVRWYDSPVGGRLLHTGYQFTTPELCETGYFYVEGEDTVNGCKTASRFERVIPVYADPLCLAWNRPNVNDTLVTCGNGVLLGSPLASDTLEYFWSPPAGLSNNTIARPFARPSVSTTYTLTVRSPSTKCLKTCMFRVNVAPAPFASITASRNVFCESEDALLTVSPNDPSNFNYQWTPAIGLDDPTAPVTLARPGRTTTYTVRITDKTHGCTDTASIVLQVRPRPVLKMADKVGICLPDVRCVSVNASFSGSPPYTFQWFPTQGVDKPNELNTTICPSVTTDYVLNATDATGCTVSGSLKIIVGQTKADFVLRYSSLTADGNGSQEITLDGTETQTWNSNRPCDSRYAQLPATVSFINRSLNAVSYLWDFGDGQTSREENPVHEYRQKGEYCIRLIATGTEGCLDTLTFCKLKVGNICEHVLQCIEVPNAFSPNGDNVNPEFFIPYLRYHPVAGDCIESFILRIYDRWGHMIFETLDPGKGWDGKEFNGNSMIQNDKLIYENVFVWTLAVKTKLGYEVNKVGNVTVIK